jgi:hypothetical protein
MNPKEDKMTAQIKEAGLMREKMERERSIEITKLVWNNIANLNDETLIYHSSAYQIKRYVLTTLVRKKLVNKSEFTRLTSFHACAFCVNHLFDTCANCPGLKLWDKNVNLVSFYKRAIICEHSKTSPYRKFRELQNLLCDINNIDLLKEHILELRRLAKEIADFDYE